MSVTTAMEKPTLRPQLAKIVDNLDHNRDKLYEFDALGRMMNAKGGTAAGGLGKFEIV